MAYLLVIFAVLGIFLGGLKTHIPLVSNLENSLSDKMFPKNEREILIDNLTQQQGIIERFLSTSGQKIIQGKPLTDSEKQSLQEAMTSAQKAKDTLDNLSDKEKEDNSLVKNILVKTLNLTPSESPSATYVPPNCKLVCNK